MSFVFSKLTKKGFTPVNPQVMIRPELAEKMGIKQPLISKLESGKYNPSVKFLRRVAKGLDAELKITVYPI